MTSSRSDPSLPPEAFLRIHKSYLVNLHQVESVEGNQIKLGPHTLPIGKSYQVAVKAKIAEG